MSFFAQQGIAVSAGVDSLNSMTGALSLVAGSGITITPGSGTLTIAASGGSGANTALSNLASTSVNDDLNMQSGKTLRIKNNVFLQGRNALDNADVPLIKVDTSDGVIINNNTAGNPFIAIRTPSNKISLSTDNGDGLAEIEASALDMYGDGATAIELHLWAADNSNPVGFKAPAVVAAPLTFELPGVDGSPGQVLSTNGSGVLSFATAAGLASPWASSSSITIGGNTGPAIYGPFNSSGPYIFGTENVPSGNTTDHVQDLWLQGGWIEDAGSSQHAGYLDIRAGTTAGSGSGGDLGLQSGSSDSGTAGSIYMTAGTSSSGTAGDLYFYTQSTQGGGGSIFVQPAGESAVQGAILVAKNSSKAVTWANAFVNLPQGSSDPSGVVAGSVYFNTGSGKIKVYNGTTWETVTSA